MIANASMMPRSSPVLVSSLSEAILMTVPQAANPSGAAEIGGREVVQFLGRSGLPRQVLKQVWNVANTRQGSSSLNDAEMKVALRLVALAQRQKPVTQSTLTATAFDRLPPPVISGVVLPPAAGSTPQAPGLGSVSSPPPAAGAPGPGSVGSAGAGSGSVGSSADDPSPIQLRKYQQMYSMAGGDSSGLGGRAAVEFMSKSGLGKPILRQIWMKSDVNQDGLLKRGEFCVAMHLIAMCKRGKAIPDTLSPGLAKLATDDGSGPAPTSVGSDGGAAAMLRSAPAPTPAPAAPSPAPAEASPAPAPAPAPAPGKSGSMSLADALSQYSDSLLAKEAPEPEPAPAPAPVPAPAPAAD